MRTHLDLFSGIGGFALAARWCGVETIGFAEIDPYASAVLKKHWPGVPNYGDIRNVPSVGNVWLITGGFPCQPFSCAGKRRGKTDDRHLWPAMLDVIKRVRPTWVLAENVPGIVGMVLDDVCADLEAVGFWVQSVVIPACAIDAKHRRDRVWIVANAKGGESGESETGDERKSIGRAGGNVPDGQGERLERNGAIRRTFPAIRQSEEESERRLQTMGHSTSIQPIHAGEWDYRQGRETCGPSGASEWPIEPGMGRVANGVPNRVDRIKCLGNSIVPQVAAQIIKAMIESEAYEP